MIKINTEEILQKEMDRKDFLRNTGIAFGVLTGLAAFVGKLNLLDGTSNKQANLGYGSSAYGGSATNKAPATPKQS